MTGHVLDLRPLADAKPASPSTAMKLHRTLVAKNNRQHKAAATLSADPSERATFIGAWARLKHAQHDAARHAYHALPWNDPAGDEPSCLAYESMILALLAAAEQGLATGAGWRANWAPGEWDKADPNNDIEERITIGAAPHLEAMAATFDPLERAVAHLRLQVAVSRLVGHVPVGLVAVLGASLASAACAHAAAAGSGA